jgi:hypothetical protein
MLILCILIFICLFSIEEQIKRKEKKHREKGRRKKRIEIKDGEKEQSKRD